MGGAVKVVRSAESPKSLGWPSYTEAARQQAQADAAKKTKKADAFHYAVPTGGRPPREIKYDPRWKKWKQPVIVVHFKTKKQESYDIYSARIQLFRGRLIAKGDQVWKKILSLGKLRPTKIKFDHILHGTYRPWDRFANGDHTLIYLSTVQGRIWYYDSQVDGIRSATRRDFVDTVTWGAFASAAKSAEGMVELYKSMVYFASMLAPYGWLLRFGVTAASMAVFWDHHQEEIRRCYEKIKAIVKALKVINRKSPKLGLAMLRVTILQSAENVKKAAKKDGIVKMVLSNLDGEQFLRSVAELFGVLLKFALTRHGLSGYAAQGLAKLGLKRLAKLASSLNKFMKISRRASAVASGGGIKDPQVLVAKLITIFGDAGVTLTKDEAQEIVDEGADDDAVIKAVTSLKSNCDGLEALVIKLANAASEELF